MPNSAPSSFPSLGIWVPLLLVPLSFSRPRLRHVLPSISLLLVSRHHPASPSSFSRVVCSPPPTTACHPLGHCLSGQLPLNLASLPASVSLLHLLGALHTLRSLTVRLPPRRFQVTPLSLSLIPPDRPPALPPSTSISVSFPSSVFPSFCLPLSQPPKGSTSLGTAVPAFLSLSGSRHLSGSLLHLHYSLVFGPQPVDRSALAQMPPLSRPHSPLCCSSLLSPSVLPA